MNRHMTRSVLLFLLSTVFAQTMTAAPRIADAQEAADYMPGQLQQLVAPVALYPDDLLGEILMASSYPYEVAMAAQWRNDNPGLSGDYLTTAVEQMSWDPSVKSLTEFPQVLQMMNSNMDWTEKLGEAFLDDQPDLMGSVQQLRQQALASGALSSSRQMTVTTDQDGYITIGPTDPSQVDVPYYDPATVFSPWQYPDDAPYAFAAPAGVVYAPGAYVSYYSGVIVVNALWGWDRWDWREHHLRLDAARWSNLDNGHAPPQHKEWHFDPAHRHDVPYKNAAVRAHFESAPPQTLRVYRGYQERANVPAAAVAPVRQTNTEPAIIQPHYRMAEPAHARVPAEPGHQFVPPVQNNAVVETRQPDHPQRQAQTPPAPPVFQSFGSGVAARMEAMRGNASAKASERHEAPAVQHAPPPPTSQPSAKVNLPDRPQKDK